MCGGGGGGGGARTALIAARWRVLPAPSSTTTPLAPFAPTRPLQVWLRGLRYRLGCQDADAARRTLEQALQALPRGEHVRMITQAALLEFKQGDAGERAGGWRIWTRTT